MSETTVVAPPEMKLSEAIYKGLEMRPKKAKGVYFAGEDRSDIFGAAYQGATGNTDVRNYQVGCYLDDHFPILEMKASHPETAEVKTVKEILRELCDVQGWKRRNIARWLSAVEWRNA